jgi:hypothetical protein
VCDQCLAFTFLAGVQLSIRKAAKYITYRSVDCIILHTFLIHQVELFYNKIFSERTQLPFAYADLPFSCAVDSPVTHQRHGLNLGELFRGDRIVNSGKGLYYFLIPINNNNPS